MPKYKKDDLGTRMKEYERVPNIVLTKRMPLILRIDGKAFHTFTKKFDRPFDADLSSVMQIVSARLVKEIQGAKLAYTQSDEISILITDYDKLTTASWFDKKVQKIVSVASSIATMEFMKNMYLIDYEKLITDEVMFDCRAFVLPKKEVANYFVWRQQDATRNSIQMLARAYFSHNECNNKTCPQLQDMLIDKYNINWNDIPIVFKRGFCCTKKNVDANIPIFTANREYIEQYVNCEVE